MGCFNFTCSITRTSISEGDRVLLLIVNPDIMYENPGDLLYHIYLYKQTLDIDYKPYSYMGVGYYDDYGGIDHYTQDTDVGHHIMFHTESIEKVLGVKLEDGDITDDNYACNLLKQICGSISL